MTACQGIGVAGFRLMHCIKLQTKILSCFLGEATLGMTKINNVNAH